MLLHCYRLATEMILCPEIDKTGRAQSSRRSCACAVFMSPDGGNGAYRWFSNRTGARGETVIGIRYVRGIVARRRRCHGQARTGGGRGAELCALRLQHPLFPADRGDPARLPHRRLAREPLFRPAAGGRGDDRGGDPPPPLVRALLPD